MEQKIFPTWGYKPDGSAQIFNLKEGEELPEGWSARMELWNHPNTRHLHPRPAAPPREAHPADEYDIVTDGPKKRGPGRPRSPESTGL